MSIYLHKPTEPTTIHEQLQIALYHVARSSYRSLRLRDNTHPHWALSYVATGNVETVCRGVRYSVRQGDIMIHPPHVAYSELADERGTHEWTLLEATLAPNLDLLRLHPVAPVVTIPGSENFHATFDALLTTWHTPDTAFRSLRLFALTSLLLDHVLRSWQVAGSPPRPPEMHTNEDRFSRVIGYMSDHIGDKVTRATLAEQLCLHPVYFDRAFRQTYGIPPMQMLRAMRLRRAQQLLESTDWTLEAVAHACGFGQAAYLLRVFRAHTGQTPGEYRQRLKSATASYQAFL